MTRWRGADVRLVLLGTDKNRPQQRTLADWRREIVRWLGFAADNGGRVYRGGFGLVGRARSVAS